MRHRHGKRELVEDGDPAEDALQDDGEQREKSERTHAAPRIADHRPQREHDGEAADRGGGESVAVLEEHAPDHWREDLPEGKWPVRNRESRAGAGDQPAEKQQDEGRPRRRDGEAMESGAGTLRHALHTPFVQPMCHGGKRPRRSLSRSAVRWD